MITKEDVIKNILGEKRAPVRDKAFAFAPANIALVKYWGKRNSELNLPVTSSLSLSLAHGTHTTIQLADDDSVVLNEMLVSPHDSFTKRLITFCDLFRPKSSFFHIETKNEIPTAAGFASSSSGFAACVLALNELFDWRLDPRTLSILARLGSGSASRSLYSGFAQWHRGTQEDGMDSFSEPLAATWPELEIRLVTISDSKKPIDSRTAMNTTVQTSRLYKSWPEQVEGDLRAMHQAINEKNFPLLGETAERNALAMHATMMASSPPILYWQSKTVSWMQRIWQLRKEGLNVYFTMDAGPNIKLLYLKKDAHLIPFN